MRYETIKDKYSRHYLIKDNKATRFNKTSRSITVKEYAKIRPKDVLKRQIDFVFIENEVKSVATDLALFLTRKYEDVVIINEKQEEIIRIDLLDKLSYRKMIRLYSKLYKEYYGKMKAEHNVTELTTDEKKGMIREIVHNNNLDLTEQLKKYEVWSDDLETA